MNTEYMDQAVVTLFTLASCPSCRKVQEALTARGVRFEALDIGADRDALVLLLRFAGRPIVPTLIAFGEVMIGYDPARLEHVLAGLLERADRVLRGSAEEDAQIRETAEGLDAAEREARERGES